MSAACEKMKNDADVPNKVRNWIKTFAMRPLPLPANSLASKYAAETRRTMTPSTEPTPPRMPITVVVELTPQ